MATNVLPGTMIYNCLVSAQIGGLVQKAAPVGAVILRTAPGMSGIDIEVQAGNTPATGFQLAEIKPMTNSGFRSFRAQVARGKLADHGLAITYNAKGDIFYGFPGPWE
jgi:hypothetical protein